MKNEKRWKKPEIKVLFSGTVNNDVMVIGTSGRPQEDDYIESQN